MREIISKSFLFPETIFYHVFLCVSGIQAVDRHNRATQRDRLTPLITEPTKAKASANRLGGRCRVGLENTSQLLLVGYTRVPCR